MALKPCLILDGIINQNLDHLNRLSQRNLLPEQKTYLIGIQYRLEKKEVGDHEGNQYLERGQNEPLPKTAEKIAEQHHVSPATVKRAEKFAEASAVPGHLRRVPWKWRDTGFGSTGSLILVCALCISATTPQESKNQNSENNYR
jgi:hypothetical protein